MLTETMSFTETLSLFETMTLTQFLRGCIKILPAGVCCYWLYPSRNMMRIEAEGGRRKTFEMLEQSVYVARQRNQKSACLRFRTTLHGWEALASCLEILWESFRYGSSTHEMHLSCCYLSQTSPSPCNAEMGSRRTPGLRSH